MSDQPPKPFQFSVLKLLGFVGVLCVVLALFIPAIRAAQEAGRRQTCVNNLKMIGIALHNYHGIYGHFPPPYTADSKENPLHSWRVALQPYLTSSSFSGTFDLALSWDNPKNLKVSAPWSRIFQCPSVRQPAGSGFTNYVMVVGQKRRAPSGKDVSFDNHPNAIIVVEIADSDIHWTEPRDLNFDEMSFKINDKTKPSISSHHAHGALVVYADGSVHFLDESTDPDELRKLLTENLDEASGRGKQP